MRLRRLLGQSLLLLLTFGTFAPVCFNQYIWDDSPHITDNANLRTLGGLVSIWIHPSTLPQFYPVFHTFLWVEYRFWGTDPAGFHVVSLLFHAANVLLLLHLLRRLRCPGAWFAAALFAIHPLQAETVAWAMEFKTILSAFFYFLALSLLLPCWDIAGSLAGEPARQRRRYLLGTLFFLLSLLSKSVTATLPEVLLLLAWWKHGTITRKDLKLALPLVLMGTLSGGYTALLERVRVGADGPDWDISFLHRVLIAGRALCFYTQELFWPRHLAFFYARWEIGVQPIEWVYPSLVVAVVVAAWFLRHRVGRGPVTAILFFIGTLFPALGFANVFPMRFAWVADHFQYLACIGIFALVAAGFVGFFRMFPSRRVHFMLPVLCAVPLLILSLLSFHRARIFHDEYSLFTDNVRAVPDSWAAHTMLYAQYLDRGDVSDAIEQAAMGVQLRPNDPDARECLVNALRSADLPFRGGNLLALPRSISTTDPRLLFLLQAAFDEANQLRHRDHSTLTAATRF